MPSLPLLDSPTATISLAVAVLGIVAFSRWRSSQSLPYPPGPPPDPIIGNIRVMASGNLERVFAGWGKEYGASFQRFPYFRRSHSACACFFTMTKGGLNYVTVIGRPLIVLNSFQVARNLLEKRSGIYSGRPRLVMMAELCACFFFST